MNEQEKKIESIELEISRLRIFNEAFEKAFNHEIEETEEDALNLEEE